MTSECTQEPNESAIWAAGCMSGTSLDGVDVAMIRTDGERVFDFGASAFQAYDAHEQAILSGQLGVWQASDEALDLIEKAHVDALRLLQSKISKTSSVANSSGMPLQAGFDVIGFHGQTFAHDPGGLGTYQAGNGAAISQELSTPVVWDFRTKDVAHGGQGAPLAPFFHHACAKYAIETGALEPDAPVVFVNLGGVGNLTWVDPRQPDPAHKDALLAFDTGPANAPINDAMRKRLGQAYDKGGELAAGGTVDQTVIDHVLSHKYFEKMPPKSLDRNDFHDVLREVDALNSADAIATLTALAAQSVVLALKHCPKPPTRILLCGGGRRNTTLTQMLQSQTSCLVSPVEAIGLDGDMLEAQAFAYLAVRVMRNLPTSSPTTTGVEAAICGGKIAGL